MHLICVANAAWVFASSGPSKVPFYVAGALLACWGFGIAAIGIARPGFARSARTSRLVMLTGAVVAAATVTTAVTTAGPTTETEGQGTETTVAPSNTLQLAADPTGQLAYDKTEATVSAGQLTILFENDSPVPHNVTIAQGASVASATRTIDGGRTTVTADLPAGDYDFYCSVDAHRQAGMRGVLTVR